MLNIHKYIVLPGNYDVPTGWPMKPYKRPYGGTPGPPVMYEKPSNPEDEGAGYGYSNGMQQKERDVFYYHSDHLGSTSYITDRNGNATQFVCYKPYGEALVDEHATSFEQPWKFNGKELDSETGLYYYGARYYEPVLAMWYGVDPLLNYYPEITPYNYCYENPIRYIDLFGLEGDEPENNSNVLPEVVVTAHKIENYSYTPHFYFTQGYNHIPSIPQNNYSLDVRPYLGAAATAGQELYYSKKYGTWMGKNFKLYKQSWGGNGITGGKINLPRKHLKL